MGHLALTFRNATNRILRRGTFKANSGRADIGPEEALFPDATTLAVKVVTDGAGIDFDIQYKYDEANYFLSNYNLPYVGDNSVSGSALYGDLLHSDYLDHAVLPSHGFDFDLYITISLDPVKSIDCANWMSQERDLLGPIRLCDAFLPGSHDSATYDLKSYIAPGQDVPDWVNLSYTLGPVVGLVTMDIIRDWAKAQALDLYEQLKAGSRYLDLRVMKSGPLPLSDSDFFAVHSLYGCSFDTLLPLIKKFTEEHPEEIFIIDFCHLSRYKGPDDAPDMRPQEHKDFIAKVKSYLGDYLITRNTGEDSTYFRRTFGEIWAEMEGLPDNKKRRIIALYKDADSVRSDTAIWSDDLPGVYGNAQDITTLQNTLVTELPKNKVDGRLVVTQLQLTAPADKALLTDWIVSSKTPFDPGPANLLELANRSNPSMLQWLHDYPQKQGCNIILMDNLNSGLSRQIISLNQICFGAKPSLRIPKVYAVVGGGSNLAVINTADKSIYGQIFLPATARAIACADSGAVLYVLAGEIQIIDAGDDSIIGTLPADLSAQCLALSPDGATLYCGVKTAGNNAAIDIINLATANVQRIDIGIACTNRGVCWMKVSKDGSRLYAVADSAIVAIIDLKTKTVTHSETVAGATFVADGELSPDEKRLYLICYGDSTLRTFNTTDFSWAAAVNFGKDRPWGLALSPDGSKLYLSLSDPQAANVCVLNTRDNSQAAIIPVGGNPMAIECTPDGKEVYVPNCDNNKVVVIRTQDNTIVNKLDTNCEGNLVGDFVDAPNHYHKITNRSGNQVLDAVQGFAGCWIITLSNWSGADSQQWALEDVGGNSFRIFHKLTGKVLESTTLDGRQMVFLNNWYEGSAQQWQVATDAAGNSMLSNRELALNLDFDANLPSRNRAKLPSGGGPFEQIWETIKDQEMTKLGRNSTVFLNTAQTTDSQEWHAERV